MPKKRSIFISFHGADEKKARGFDLCQYNSNVEAEFRTKHLLTAVESKDDAYVRRRIDEEMTGTSATMVLLGEKTHERKWVAEEIEKTVDNGKGVVAMYLKGVKDSLPEDSCVAEALDEAGAEILNWDPHEIGNAVERAIMQTDCSDRIDRAAPSSVSCGGR